MRLFHYCRRVNSAFQHADNSVPAIFDWSEHIKLTRVSSAIALFLCLLDYYTLTIRFCFRGLE